MKKSAPATSLALTLLASICCAQAVSLAQNQTPFQGSPNQGAPNQGGQYQTGQYQAGQYQGGQYQGGQYQGEPYSGGSSPARPYQGRPNAGPQTPQPPAAQTQTNTAPGNRVRPPVQGMLVLKNGRVLSGIVERDGERMAVTRSDRSVIRVPITLVDFVAPNLHKAYQHQARRLSDKDVEGRLRLVEWCLQYRLINEASQQLAIVKFQAPKHAKLAYLSRRIKQSNSPTRAASGTPPKLLAQGARKPAATPAELTRFTKELPEGSVEQFTHVIQPMLINRCGATACHGVRAESEYRLISPSIAGVFSHRYTQRNLLATVTQVRSKELAQTTWLKAAINPHAGLKAPLFSDKELDKLTRLVAWARTVAPVPDSKDPRKRLLEGPAVAGGGTGRKASPNSDRTFYDPAVRRAAFETPARETPAGRQARRGSYQGEAPKSDFSRPFAPPASRDPFDPKSFNQESAPAKDAPGGKQDSPISYTPFVGPQSEEPKPGGGAKP